MGGCFRRVCESGLGLWSWLWSWGGVRAGESIRFFCFCFFVNLISVLFNTTFVVVCGYHSVANEFTLPTWVKKVYQKSVVCLRGALLLGSILKITSPSMWKHEVLDPHNSSSVRLREENLELASVLLKTPHLWVEVSSNGLMVRIQNGDCNCVLSWEGPHPGWGFGTTSVIGLLVGLL